MSVPRYLYLERGTAVCTHVGRSKNSGNPWETPTGVGINDQICVTKVMEARHVSRDNQCRHMPGFGKQYRIIPKIKTMFKTAVEIAYPILQKPMLSWILPPSEWRKLFMSECAFVKEVYLTPLCLRSALDPKVASAVRTKFMQILKGKV
jgi:hypothetical protein